MELVGEENEDVRGPAGLSCALMLSCILGWSLFWVWTGLMSSSAFLRDGAPLGYEAARIAAMIVMGAYVAARVLGFASARFLDPLLHRRGMLIGVGVAATVGSSAAVGLSIGTSALTAVPGVLVGLAAFLMAFLSTAWAHILAQIDSYRALLCILLGFASSSLIYCAISSYSFLIAVVACLAPLGSAMAASNALCVLASGQVPNSLSTQSECWTSAAFERRITSRRSVAFLVLAVFCYGSVGTLVRMVAGENSALDVSTLTVSGLCHFLGIGVCAVALCVFALSRNWPLLTAPSLGRAILVVMSFGMLVSGLSGGVPSAATNFITGLAIGCLEILLLMYSSLVSRQTGLSAFKTLGVTYGTMELANLIGSTAWYAAPTAALPPSLPWQNFALVALFACVVASMALLALFDRGGYRGGSRPFERCSEVEDAEGQRALEAEAASLRSLQEHYGLTKRETEVAALLYAGRSIPYIQKELHVSRGTAQTHVYHIYQKMDVHSKQDFIDLAQGFFTYD